MSLGSNVRSEALGNETLTNILQTFREIPYKILWKFKIEDPEQMKNIPKNAKIISWANQQLILSKS